MTLSPQERLSVWTEVEQLIEGRIEVYDRQLEQVCRSIDPDTLACVPWDEADEVHARQGRLLVALRLVRRLKRMASKRCRQTVSSKVDWPSDFQIVIDGFSPDAVD